MSDPRRISLIEDAVGKVWASRGRANTVSPRSFLLPAATALATIATFVADTVSHVEIAFAVLYVVVVLMAARFLRARGVLLVAIGCGGLSILSFFLTPPATLSGITNHAISLLAISLTTLIALQSQSAEATLRDQASLLDLTHDTIFVRNMSDVITYWNRGAEELYGWRSAEAVGRVCHELTRTIFPKPLEEIKAKLLRTGRWEGELIHAKRDGTRVVVASRWALQQDERGNPRAILETNTDITERKNAEEALRRSRDELEIKVKERTGELRKANIELQSVNKELEAFAYSVSHDLRAPVRHIAGFTELLQRQAGAVLDDKGRHHIGMILDAAKRMGALVDDLLAFSRIGRAETQKTTVHLEQLIKGVVGEIGPDTQGRKIAWRIGSLPICYGDPSMLRLVFANLVSNAVKFTRTRPQAEIEIGSSNHTADETVVFVKDNGVGFDMKYEDKLFGVFQRLHSQEAFEGTGIGLATVQRIVHRHGGRVWAEGSIGNGATFYVALPKPGKVNP